MTPAELDVYFALRLEFIDAPMVRLSVCEDAALDVVDVRLTNRGGWVETSISRESVAGGDLDLVAWRIRKASREFLERRLNVIYNTAVVR